MVLGRIIGIAMLIFASYQVVSAQVLEAAYCEWDDVFDEWKIAINEDEMVDAVRQFGQNPYRRWNFDFEDIEGEQFTGYMQLKRVGDLNYWDFHWQNENLYITTIFRNDLFTWKIVHDDIEFSMVAKDRFGYAWEDRYEREFDWEMYQVEEGDFRQWYIDDSSDENLSLPMRLAAAMIIIELSTFSQ